MKTIIVTILLAGSVFTLPIFSQTANIATPKDSVLSIGSPAPTFYLKCLDGSEFYSRDYFGTPREGAKSRTERNHAVLSFFATYCEPCRKEIPELEKLQTKYPQIKFVLIDVNEKKETVEAHLATTPIKLSILLDRYGKIAEMYNVKDNANAVAVLPTLVIISKDGTVRYYKKGYREEDEHKIEAELRKLKP